MYNQGRSGTHFQPGSVMAKTSPYIVKIRVLAQTYDLVKVLIWAEIGTSQDCERA